MNYFFPGKVFMYLISIAVAAVVVSWFVIVVTHMKYRRLREKQNTVKLIRFKSLGYPFINYLCLAFLAMIVVLMTQVEDMQLAVALLPVWILLLWGGFKFKHRNK